MLINRLHGVFTELLARKGNSRRMEEGVGGCAVTNNNPRYRRFATSMTHLYRGPVVTCRKNCICAFKASTNRPIDPEIGWTPVTGVASLP